ncbi:DUF2577 domain-containing protein [Clostridium botulinum]|uniref:DUF2577 domain-containing protein n=1 Tax=Clostridium botulinum TaxID=1491 RepID=A0A6M0SQ39_CLOBO|nr:DUF2577 domain-containing protein [Clostridium botulinum]NFO35150.1 DUF2577 domain-containing protein [Clostridium botulinum]NFO48372.1 DUF2577 domain-containing protein [Clostridium botulinum]NFO58657.1 DUF2577 domain-containing protein [Clostridium botulinum]
MWDNRLAQEFRKRDNSSNMGAVIGDVMSTTPLRVAIQNGAIVLSEDKLYLCSNLKNQVIRSGDIIINSVADHGTVSSKCNLTFTEVLKIGDKVVCLPADGGQTFFIIDKVV